MTYLPYLCVCVCVCVHCSTHSLQGPWKLIVGYPGWSNSGQKGWDGWTKPPMYNKTSGVWSGTRSEIIREKDLLSTAFASPYNASAPCEAKPCLFNIVDDPTEHHDVNTQENAAIVAELQAIFDAEAKTEVTVEASGLCPTSYGIKPDPRCGAKAIATGWWQPWLADP